MTLFCRAHVKDRTDEELKARFKALKLRTARGEKLGPGLGREFENITKEWAERRLKENADPGMDFLEEDT